MGFYEGLKDAAGVLKKAGKIEEYQQILEGLDKLLDMQKRIGELESENDDLRRTLEIQGKLVPQDNMYYSENDGVKDGPFCTSCWDAAHKLIRLHVSRHFGSATCPTCKTVARPGQAIVVPNSNQWRNSAR